MKLRATSWERFPSFEKLADRLLGKDGPEGSLLAEFLFFPNSHQKDQRNTKIREKVGLYPQTRLAC